MPLTKKMSDITKHINVNHPRIWGYCETCGLNFWGKTPREGSRHFLLGNGTLSVYISHLVGRGDISCTQFINMTTEDIINGPP